jgi:hypothetical protein
MPTETLDIVVTADKLDTPTVYPRTIDRRQGHI